jgi:outer membrane receptor protein involved in Fe transport
LCKGVLRFFTVFLLLLSSVSSAQEAKEADSLKVEQKRFEEKVFELFTSGAVISSEDIDNSLVKNLGDVLKEYRAIDVTSYGVYAQPQVASIWGGSSQLFSVFLDNIPCGGQALYFPQTADLDLNTFSFRDIERIEVYDGPVLDVLGTAAGLGGLNIVAKDYEGEEPYSRAAFQRGRDGYRHTMLELGRDFLNQGRFYLTSEFRKYGGKIPRSSSESVHLTGKFSFEINPYWGMSFHALHYNADTEVPQFTDAFLQPVNKEESDWTLNLRSRHRMGGNANLTFDLLYSPETQKLKGEGEFFPQEKKEKTISLKASFDKELSAHHLILRSSLRKNSFDQDRNPHNSLWEGNFSLADLFQPNEKLTFLLFLKGDKFGELDPDLSTIGGISYSPDMSLNFFSNLGLNHSYPSLHDLYLDLSYRGARPEGPDGNTPRFRGKEILSFDGGARLDKRNFKASLSAIYSRIDGNILWIGDRPEKRNTDVFGFHQSMKLIPHRNLEAYLSYAYKKSKYDESDNRLALPFVPEHSLFSFIQYKNERLKRGLGASVRLEGEFLSSRYLGYEENEKVPEVFLVHLKFDLRFLDFHFYYVIENMTDQEYRTRKEFEMEGRSHWWGFYWEFFD